MTNHFTITLTEDQLIALQNACEWIGRLKMGQFDVLKEICTYHRKGLNIDYEDFRDLEKQLKTLLFPELDNNSYYGICNEETGDEAKILWDIYQVIREYNSFNRNLIDEYCTVDYDNPLITSEEPLIKISSGYSWRDIHLDFFKRFRNSIREKTRDMSDSEKQQFISECKKFAEYEDIYIKFNNTSLPEEQYNKLFNKTQTFTHSLKHK